MKHCPKCEHDVFETDYVCMNCGANLVQRPPAARRQQEQEQPPPEPDQTACRHRTGGPLVALGTLAGIAVAMALLALVVRGTGGRGSVGKPGPTQPGPVDRAQGDASRPPAGPPAGPGRRTLLPGSADPAWRKAQEPEIQEAARSATVDRDGRARPVGPSDVLEVLVLVGKYRRWGNDLTDEGWRQHVQRVNDELLAAGCNFEWQSNNRVLATWAKSFYEVVELTTDGWVAVEQPL